MLGFFVLLLAMAWPAFRHHAAALFGDAAIAAIEGGQPLSDSGLERAQTSRVDALAIQENSRTRRELGQAYLRRVVDPLLRSPAPEADVTAAASAIRRALARSPADHFAWYHLAAAESLSGEREVAAAALARAFEFGPFHPPIRRARARLGLVLWDELDAGGRKKVLADLTLLQSANRR